MAKKAKKIGNGGIGTGIDFAQISIFLNWNQNLSEEWERGNSGLKILGGRCVN